MPRTLFLVVALVLCAGLSLWWISPKPTPTAAEDAADVEPSFEDTARRMNELVDCLRTSEVVEIVGLVGPLGPGGGKSQGEKLWTLHFSFEAWRGPDGKIDERPLTIRKQVTAEELDVAMDSVDSYDILRARVRYSEECQRASGISGPQALLTDLIPEETSDSDLQELASELKKPVIVTDEFFGELQLDRAVNWLEGKKEWRSEEVRIQLSLDDCEDQEALLRVAENLWRDQVKWDRRVRDFSVDELLDLKNSSWLDENEQAVSPQEFKDRITLESITVYPDGTFEFFFSDGELFWGHTILVSGSISEGPTDADIAG